MRKLNLWLCAAVASNAIVASQAFASGFEKSIMWGARSAGVGGIATPYITGSQSLYFNPAGLVNDKIGSDVSFNISPTWTQTKANIGLGVTAEADSKQSFSTPFGLIYNGTINENWGFGIGGYVSGGARSIYENVQYGGIGRFDYKTDITVTEIAAGVGYKVNDNFKLGAAWRVVMASADFSSIRPTGATTGSVTSLSGLKDENFAGFKVGGQYKFSDKTKIGLTYRSEVKLEAEGDATVTNYSAGTPTVVASGVSGKAKTVFPMQVNLGLEQDLSDIWTLFAEYGWTNYKTVENIDLEVNGTAAQLPTRWKDQHNVRVAGEYTGAQWPVRFGYGWTSQVTNSDYAAPTFTPPGDAHTITLGTGQMWSAFDMPLQFDVAGEYTMVSGDAPASTASPQYAAGKREGNAYALHLGLTYAF